MSPPTDESPNPGGAPPPEGGSPDDPAAAQQTLLAGTLWEGLEPMFLLTFLVGTLGSLAFMCSPVSPGPPLALPRASPTTTPLTFPAAAARSSGSGGARARRRPGRS